MLVLIEPQTPALTMKTTDTLRMEVVSHQRFHILKSCLLFEELETSLLRRIGYRLTSLVASPGDEIVRENDIGYSMFFLTKGFANVVSNHPKTLYSTVVTGSFFGESALFKESKRVASVVAVGYCELLELARQDLEVSPLFRPPSSHSILFAL